jgi:hypothetical protein
MKCPKCDKDCKDLSSSGSDIERGLIYHCEEHGDVK